MPLGNIGVTGLILILLIALIIFGPSKPELGRAFGRTLSEFKTQRVNWFRVKISMMEIN